MILFEQGTVVRNSKLSLESLDTIPSKPNCQQQTKIVHVYKTKCIAAKTAVQRNHEHCNIVQI
jgi:hypothetical protein